MNSRRKVQLHHINNYSYQDLWDFQQTLHTSLIKNKKKESRKNLCGHFILCEHRPVFTLGKSGSLDNLLESKEKLTQKNIEFFKINRGGDITYHGPGQITGYMVLDLDDYYHDIHRYVREIEQSVIHLLTKYGLKGKRVEGYTGVWIKKEKSDTFKKICAIGVHMSRWVSLHGFALNVQTDLDMFKKIIPCGIEDKNKTVTSLHLEVDQQININQVIPKLTMAFSNVFGFEFV